MHTGHDSSIAGSEAIDYLGKGKMWMGIESPAWELVFMVISHPPVACVEKRSKACVAWGVICEMHMI
jgi:hypothetical protein